MINQVYREFFVSFTPLYTVEQEGDRPRHRFNCEVSLKELATSTSHVFQCSGFTPDIDWAVEREIASKFPNSKAAAEIRNKHGSSLVTLEPNWDQDLGSQLHLALRKCGTGSSTSFWWHLLHELPALVTNKFYARSEQAIRDLNVTDAAPVRVSIIARAVRQAWLEVLEEAMLLDPLATTWRQAELGREALKAKGWNVDSVESLPIEKLEYMRTMLSTAARALDYLSGDDWIVMLTYVVRYKE